MDKSGFLFCLLVVILAVVPAFSLRCYLCSGSKDCNDDINTGSDDVTQITEIGDDACILCAKSKIWSFGAHQVGRSCITDTRAAYQEGCFTQEDENQDVTVSCFCSGDDCNHSNILSISMATMLFALLIHKFV